VPPRIEPKKPRHIYLAEWRERCGLTQVELARRLGVSSVSVSRWELGRALLNTDVMAAVAEAFDIEPQDLFRHPDQQSADALLRDQPAEIQDLVIRIIKAIPR
jgi:transcriptional regulator with XRE-family HTH domain